VNVLDVNLQNIFQAPSCLLKSAVSTRFGGGGLRT